MQFRPSGHGVSLLSPVGQLPFLIMMRECFCLKKKMHERFSHPSPLLLAREHAIGAQGLSQANGGNSPGSLLLKFWQHITEQF